MNEWYVPHVQNGGLQTCEPVSVQTNDKFVSKIDKFSKNLCLHGLVLFFLQSPVNKGNDLFHRGSSELFLKLQSGLHTRKNRTRHREGCSLLHLEMSQKGHLVMPLSQAGANCKQSFEIIIYINSVGGRMGGGRACSVCMFMCVHASGYQQREMALPPSWWKVSGGMLSTRLPRAHG